MNLIKDKIPVLGLDIIERRSSFSLILPGVHQLQVPGSDFVVVISDVVVVVSDADIDEVAANFRSIEVF